MTFCKFFNNKNVVNFLYKYEKYYKANKNAFLVGKNYTCNNVDTIKLYCEIKNSDINLLYNFFNSNELIDKLLPYWNNTRESSLCVGIKYFIEKKVFVNYFHIKFNLDKELDDFKKPKNLFVPKNNLRGASVEFINNKCFLKKYYYYNTQLEKLILCKKYNLKSVPDHFEYTESKDSNKVIFVYDNKSHLSTSKELLKKQNKFIENDIKDIFYKINKLPSFYGSYIGSDITSVYWSLTDNSNLYKEL